MFCEGFNSLPNFRHFRIFRSLRVFAHISLVSWRRWPFGNRHADNKQKSQAEILENSFRWQDFPLYVIFLDWVKCYDKIHHGPFLDALRRFGLPRQYLDVITAFYKDLRFFVRDAWGESDLRPQAEGLRQGDPLACFLLLIFTTIIM